MIEDFSGNYGASVWSATKFVSTRHSSVNSSPSTLNMLSQKLSFTQKRISVGWIAVYLNRAKSELNTSFSIHAAIYESDENGHMIGSSLSSDSLLSSEINSDNWYKFNIVIPEMDTPENGFCLTLWQEGGDEDNYASWSYAVVDKDTGCSITEDGGVTWLDIKNSHRLVRAASNFDAYKKILGNNPTYKIVTPPAVLSEGIHSGLDKLSSGSFHNTIVSSSTPYYQSDSYSIKVEPHNLHISYVVDSSGSMGWNDRFSIRKDIISNLMSSFRDKFPGVVTYDFIQFGAKPLSTISLSSTKRVAGVFVGVDSYSSVTGFDSDGIALSDDVRYHMGTGVVSYGFKSLSSSKYLIYGFNTGLSEFRLNTVSDKWKPIWSSDSPSLSVSEEGGPSGDSCLTVNLINYEKNAIRYVYGFSNDYVSSILTENAEVGDESLSLESPHPFAVGDSIRISSASNIDQPKVILSSSETSISISPEVRIEMNSSGSIVEKYTSQPSKWGSIDGFEFYIVDENGGGPISFFIQTLNGAHIEWEFTPMTAWETYELYFLDETALFEIDAVDADENPLPDGSTVEFYVDKDPTKEIDDADEESQDQLLLVSDALTGSSIIYVSPEDASLLSRGDTIDIVDEDRNGNSAADSGAITYHSTIISSVDLSGVIGIADAMPSDYLVSKKSSIVTPATKISTGIEVSVSNKIPIVANLVDITPIFIGESHDPSLLNPLDPPQVSPSSSPDDYNDDPTRVFRSSIEVITKNGWAAVRVCPITEDKFENSSTRNSLAKSMFNKDEREQVRDKSIEDMENGEMKDGVDDSEYDQPTSSEEIEEPPVYYGGEGTPDFIMDHKVYVSDGYASTKMKSFATELTDMKIGSNLIVNYLAKKYTIYPVITMYDSSGEKNAIILCTTTDVYFASPIYIKNSVDKTVMCKGCIDHDSDGKPIVYDQEVTGVYATDEDVINITYEVTNKGFLTNGYLNISVYDLRRSIQTRSATDDDLPDVSGCGDSKSLDGVENVFSSSDEKDEYTLSTKDSLLASEFLNEAQFTVPVIAGKATVILPPLNRVALLEVHASFDVESGYSKVVNKQKIYYLNPVVVVLSGMTEAVADGESKHNIGAYVSWKNLYPVNDGTMVNFESANTPISPSVSQTIGGSADGVLIGPHAPIPAPTGAEALEDSGRGEFEQITAICSYNGFTVRKGGEVEWMREPSKVGGDFFFYATGYNTNQESIFHRTKSIWSDGLDYITINGDLPASSFRAFPTIEKIADELIESKIGVVYSGSGLSKKIILPRWSATRPSEGPYEEDVDVPVGWVSNRMYSNKFIGMPPYREPDEDDPFPCRTPECIEVTLFTMSRKYGYRGVGIDSDTVSFPPNKIPRPRVNVVEPFWITVYIEPVDYSEYQTNKWRRQPNGTSPTSYGYDAYAHPINRNGINRYVAVAELTWRNGFIIGRNDNQLPSVSWDIGQVNFGEKGAVDYSRLEDRTVCPLDFDETSVSHVRTSFDYSHFHTVSIDDNGKGQTVKTISYEKDIIIPDHIHYVDLYSEDAIEKSSYDNSDGSSNYHSHNLKSVAVVGIGPVSDKTIVIAVKAMANYDNGKKLIDGTRTERIVENYAFSDSHDDSGDSGDSGYFLDIIPSSSQYVDGQIIPGFSARMNGKAAGSTMLFHAYTKNNGVEIPVADGTRIFSDFCFYEYNDVDSKNEKDDNDIVIVGKKDDAPRTIAVLKTSAFIPGLPEELRAENKSVITSELKWLPSVDSYPLITKPETDELTFNKAVASLSEIGPSRLNDAIALAARRMITYSSYLESSKKVIVVLSDGGESNSEISYDQAISQVKSVDYESPVSLAFIKLERTELYDDLVVGKYVSDLDGVKIEVSNIEDTSTIPSYVYDSLINSTSFDALTGWYSNIIDLGDKKLFDRMSFSSVTPGESSLSFSIRFSSDGFNFGEWIDIGSGSDFDLSGYGKIYRYMEYKIYFRVDASTFESPEVSSISYEYYEPRRYTLMFQPIPISEGKDGYVGEILFAHHGGIPSTSTVTYGVKHSSGTDNDWYWSSNQPAMINGYGGIVLSRVNELLIRKDASTFEASYGGWSDDYLVSLYKINKFEKYGVIVPSSEYTYNNKDGVFVFGASQNASDIFTVTLSMRPYFKIAVDIVNNGSKTASIDYIGAMYRPVDKSYMYDSDRRPVYSSLETDYTELGMEPSKTISKKSIVYNNAIGFDSDILIDYVVNESIGYVLQSSSEGVFITSLRDNFTVISRNVLNGCSGTPTSCSYMDNYLFVCFIEDDKYTVHRFDSNYNSMYSFDAGYTWEHSGVIRSKLDLWYVFNGEKISIRNRSFREISTLNIPFEMSGRFHVGEYLSFLTKYGDSIVKYDASAELKSVYIISDRASKNDNIFVNGDIVSIVKNSSLSLYE